MKINKGIFIMIVGALQGYNENKTNHTPSLLVLYNRQKHAKVASS
jgi:hypothetical protein